jgi:hypothetical protein
VDITYAHFDFAPDAGHGYWSFPGAAVRATASHRSAVLGV